MSTVTKDEINFEDVKAGQIIQLENNECYLVTKMKKRTTTEIRLIHIDKDFAIEFNPKYNTIKNVFSANNGKCLIHRKVV